VIVIGLGDFNAEVLRDIVVAFAPIGRLLRDDPLLRCAPLLLGAAVSPGLSRGPSRARLSEMVDEGRTWPSRDQPDTVRPNGVLVLDARSVATLQRS